MLNNLKNILNRPSSATVEGWAKWKKETKENRPWMYFFFDTIPSWFGSKFYRLRMWYYDMRATWFHPYNVLKSRDLKPTYSDITHRLIYFNFELLQRYYEIEYSRIDWEWDPEHKRVGDEIKFLYEWWTQDFLKREDSYKVYPIPDKYNKEEFDSFWDRLAKGLTEEEVALNKLRDELEEKRTAEDEEMLIRLIKIRDHLWS